MENRRLELAAKLVAKAQSTEYDAEAVSLLTKCCRLISDVVACADPAPAEPVRCRRHSPRPDPSVVYGQLEAHRRPVGVGHVDVLV